MLITFTKLMPIVEKIEFYVISSKERFIRKTVIGVEKYLFESFKNSAEKKHTTNNPYLELFGI